MQLYAFGITKDIIGEAILSFPIQEDSIQVQELKALLFKKFPDLLRLPSFAISVNLLYASDETWVNKEDEIALIPPVSGG